MYPRSFLCEEAKDKQRTPLKKELCEIFFNYKSLLKFRIYLQSITHSDGICNLFAFNYRFHMEFVIYFDSAHL